MNTNQVIVEGRLTRAPEMKNFESATNARVANFGVAVNNPRKNKDTGEWEDRPAFIDCEAWNYEADRAMTLDKGDAVIIVGRIKMDQWQDKESGKNRSVLRLNVDTVGRQIVMNGGSKFQAEEEDIPF